MSFSLLESRRRSKAECPSIFKGAGVGTRS